MYEYIINLHIHTLYSDGSGSHAEIAKTGIKVGLDVVIITDHNICVKGPEGYYKNGDQKVLLLIGEEVHDQTRDPQKNHLLIIGAERELAAFAEKPQRLIDEVKKAGGLCFLAHPHDRDATIVGEPSISWDDWDVKRFTGIELWNSSAEYKAKIKSIFHAIYYAYFPKRITTGPFPDTLEKWDHLMVEGARIVALGGSDAHAQPYQRGPFHRVIFPYEHLFKGVNSHILTDQPLQGDYETDRQIILNALGGGHIFIGYDLPAPTRGFRFTAHGSEGTVCMGDEVICSGGVTLQINIPNGNHLKATCQLLKNGKIIKRWHNKLKCTLIITEPGIYRVEVYLHYEGHRRGWIYSNPIYIR